MKISNPFNSINIQGTIWSEPTIRKTKEGIPFYMEFCLQTERIEKRFNKETQKFQKVFDYNNIVIEGEKDVEFAQKYYRKGDRICISGEARSSTYKTQDGVSQIRNYILVNAGRWAMISNAVN